MTEIQALSIKDVEDDPKRPFKVYAGIVGTIAGDLIARGVSDNVYVNMVLAAVGAAAGIYITPSPKRKKKPKNKSPRKTWHD
jgi:hypothetical protein